ncbi:MAG: response regulator [Pseudomonadota bacterium]
MNVLIVEGDPDLCAVWSRHLERLGATVIVAPTENAAIHALRSGPIHVIILNLILPGGSSGAVADYASYRRPDARVVFVTNECFFSDGSIFKLFPNTAAFVAADTAPADLAAIVEHHGMSA